VSPHSIVGWGEGDLDVVRTWHTSEGFPLDPEQEENRRQWDRARRDLERFLLLEADWDGYGASASDPQLLETASRVLLITQERGIPPPSRLLPTQSGGVLIEWQLPGLYFDAEIVEGHTVEWMFQAEGHATEHYEWELGEMIPPRETAVPSRASSVDVGSLIAA